MPDPAHAAMPERPSPTRRRRGFAAAACAGAGVWFGLAHDAPARHATLLLVTALALSVLSALLISRARWARFGFISLAFGATLGAAAWTGLRTHAPRQSNLWRVLSSDSPPLDARPHQPIITIEGIVLEPPRSGRITIGALERAFPDLTIDQSPTARFWFGVTALKPAHADATRPAAPPVAASGRLWVGAPASALPIAPGERLRLTGRFSAPAPPQNPGERDRRLWAAEGAFAGSLSVPEERMLTRLEAPPALSRAAVRARWAALRHAVRSRAGAWMRDPSGEASAGGALLPAMLLGERQREYDELQAAFRRAGLAHLLAISGFNMTILAIAALFALRAVLPASSRLAGRAEPLVVCAIVISYTLLLPAEAPIIRAAVIVVAVAITESTGRRFDRLNTLAWAFVLLLLWKPTDLVSPGFQLSFGGVAALIALTAPLRERLFGPAPEPDTLTPFRRALLGAQTYTAANLGAWLAMAPIIAAHFGAFTPFAPFAAMAATPFVSILMIAAYALSFVSLASPTVALALAPPLHALAAFVARMPAPLDALPFTELRASLIPPALAAFGVVLVAWWVAAPGNSPQLARASRFTARSLARVAATVIACAWFALALRADARPPDGALLRIDTLSVGDGTCHLIRAPRSRASFPRNLAHPGEAMLWDCGSSFGAAGVRLIPNACRTLGAARVASVVITHPDLDHFVCLPDVVEPLGVRRVYLGGAFLRQAREQPDGPAAWTLARLDALGIDVFEAVAGDQLRLGVATISFLWPPADPGAAPRSDNDASLVARIDVVAGDGLATRSALLTGDIERPAMRALLARSAGEITLRADILELPHHGSGASAGAAGIPFVRAVAPRVILQSTGPNRLDDARWDDARAPGIRWLVTARDAAIWAQINRDGSVSSGALRRQPRRRQSAIRSRPRSRLRLRPIQSQSRPSR